MTSSTTIADVATKIAAVTNNGAVSSSITTSGGTYTIPKGYHNGSGKVTGPTLAALIGTNVTLASAGNLLTGYTAYGKNGTKYTGSMTNNGAVSKTFTPSSSSQSYTIPAGYHNGSGKVTCNAVASLSTIIVHSGVGTYTASEDEQVLVIWYHAARCNWEYAHNAIHSTFIIKVNGTEKVNHSVKSVGAYTWGSKDNTFIASLSKGQKIVISYSSDDVSALVGCKIIKIV